MTEYIGKHSQDYMLPTFNKTVEQIKQAVKNLFGDDINENDLKDRTFVLLEEVIKEIEDRDKTQFTEYEKQYIIEREKEHYYL